MDLSLVVLLLGMAALGFRHGFDWDHIAAITDITSTTSASHTEANVPAGAPMPSHGHERDEMRGHEHEHSAEGPGAMHALAESRFAHEERHAVARTLKRSVHRGCIMPPPGGVVMGGGGVRGWPPCPGTCAAVGTVFAGRPTTRAIFSS